MAEVLVGDGTMHDAVPLVSTAGWTEWGQLQRGDRYGLHPGHADRGVCLHVHLVAGHSRRDGVMTFKEAGGGARQRCIGCGSDPKVVE
jgi:hypothetical protein